MNKKLAYGGILVAVSVVLLYIAMLAPTGRLFLLALSSLPMAVLLLEFDLRTSLICYASTSLLFLIVSGNVRGVFAFILFFGIYPIVKSYIETGVRKIFMEYLLKLVFFNIVLIVLVFIYSALGLPLVEIINSFKIPVSYINISAELRNSVLIIIVWFIAQIVFLIYDYAYSLMIRYYMDKIRKI